jgi:hypothetical protein
VHRDDKGELTDNADALRWLRALERAYELVVLGVGAPVPLSDFALGGGPALDLYLSRGDAPLSVGHDADDAMRSDASSAFCTVGADSPTPDRDATCCVAEALTFRLDAAESPHLRRALAEEVWLSAGTTTSADTRAIDDVQAHPEVTLLRRDEVSWSAGASLFFDYLDTRYGAGPAGAIGFAMFALSAGEPSPAALRWRNEPDIVDVLRSTFGGTPSEYARWWSDFSVVRAFAGSRGAGAEAMLPWAGDFARVRFDWSIALSSLPRRVAGVHPIDPLGAAYLWLDIDEDPKTTQIGFRAEWEAPVAFKWTLVTVAADGRELARLDVPYLERETVVERSLVRLQGARGVLIVGTNLGDVSPTYPFDPDFEPFEPHGYTVYLAKLE